MLLTKFNFVFIKIKLIKIVLRTVYKNFQNLSGLKIDEVGGISTIFKNIV